MKLASALIAVLAVCQLQYSTAARLRNNAEFLPNVGNLIDKVKDRLQKEGSLRDEIVKQYLDNLEEQYENLKNSGEDIEASAKVSSLSAMSCFG